jgi:hypothetical protein
MPDDPLHQPHDKLSRATFSNSVNAAALLRQHLGGPLPALVDWHSLTLLPGSVINSLMAASEADLLFSAKIGGSHARFYKLFRNLFGPRASKWNHPLPPPPGATR